MPAFTLESLASYLQSDLDKATAETARDLATTMVRSYTRGVGFDPVLGDPVADLGAVILLVASRLYSNPEGMRSENIGSYAYTSTSAGFQGFSLVELALLHRYRRRAA
ncbi:MAG: hypothetical protein ACR2JO_00035 [Mycobacteriales bacterium]